MNKYIVTKQACDKHKIAFNILCITTYVIFFPFMILVYINDLLEMILRFISDLRNKIIYGIFKILYKKDCKVEEE